MPAMGKDCTFTLNENDVGQLLDGLAIRAESWERTADYPNDGWIPEGDIFVIEDCREPTEADAIAKRYRSIIKKIERQMKNLA